MSRLARNIIYSVFALAFFAVIYMLFDGVTDKVTATQRTVDDVRKERTANAAAAQANAAKVQALSRQVRGLGGKPVVAGPVTPITSSNPAASVDRLGIAAAVASYCARQECGATPSQAQLLAAIRSYCSDGCAGVKGATGDPGKPGALGKPGTDGEPGADGNPGAGGNAGSDGKPGTNGNPGTDGKPGSDGKPGADGQPGAAGPPGPPGPAGDPGPTCPEGYTGQRFEVSTPDGMRTIFACVE